MFGEIRPDFEVVKEGRILHKRDYDRLLAYHLLSGPERRSFLDYIRSCLYDDRVSSVKFAQTGAILLEKG
jgi:hypothetical protein